MPGAGNDCIFLLLLASTISHCDNYSDENNNETPCFLYDISGVMRAVSAPTCTHDRTTATTATTSLLPFPLTASLRVVVRSGVAAWRTTARPPPPAPRRNESAWFKMRRPDGQTGRPSAVRLQTATVRSNHRTIHSLIHHLLVNLKRR